MGEYVVIDDVHKSFGHVKVLKGVSISMDRGSVTALLGVSGSGKSTLLRIVNALEPLNGGKVLIDGELIGYRATEKGEQRIKGKLVARQRAQIGFVAQSINLFPHMTALENVTLGPMRVLGRSAVEARRTGMDLLGRVGLSEYAHAFPVQMSGGQQQRVAIARSLAMTPKVMLFDEPTSALDPESIREVLATMAELAKAGATMLVATHEMGFARHVASQVVYLHDGSVVEAGPPERLFNSPETDRFKQFVGAILRADAPRVDAEKG